VISVDTVDGGVRPVARVEHRRHCMDEISSSWLYVKLQCKVQYNSRAKH
jgi:hypothetical protein